MKCSMHTLHSKPLEMGQRVWLQDQQSKKWTIQSVQAVRGGCGYQDKFSQCPSVCIQKKLAAQQVHLNISLVYTYCKY